MALATQGMEVKLLLLLNQEALKYKISVETNLASALLVKTGLTEMELKAIVKVYLQAGLLPCQEPILMVLTNSILSNWQIVRPIQIM